MSHAVSVAASIVDLKVSIQESDTIHPSSSNKTDQKSMFLSHLDQSDDLNLQTLHFFTSNPDFSPESVVERLRGAVRESLDPFFFVAGRKKRNADSHKLVIDCSDSVGVGFVVAKSECTLEEIGDLAYPHPAFEQLVSLDLKRGDDKLLLNFQVTIFKCGGFSMGITNDHITFDGVSFKIYLHSLAAFAANRPMIITPYTDRHLLAAQSPSSPHIAFQQSKLPRSLLNPLDVSEQSHPLIVSVFKLDASDIAKLKRKAVKSDDQPDENTKGDASKHMISGFNVTAALIWKNRVSTICYAVDVRSRLQPRLPESYIGNAVVLAYATPSTYTELKSCSFRKVVEMVAEGAMEITHDSVRCVLDGMDPRDNEEYFYGECLVSSWCKLGIERVEYPWGKPKYYCPVVYRKKNSVVMFPSMQNEDGSLSNNGTGINVLVTHSSSEEMNIFERHFSELLEE
uniref:Uncharacterized protein n=1 Tax=Kalanchoe fedtschenkoi TaxID=63787 RepID=A0A7N0V5L4_KALFE